MASKKKRLEAIEKLLNIELIGSSIVGGEFYKGSIRRPRLNYCDLADRTKELKREIAEAEGRLDREISKLKLQVGHREFIYPVAGSHSTVMSTRLEAQGSWPEPTLHEKLNLIFDYLGIEIKKTESRSSVRIVKKKTKGGKSGE